MAYRAHPFDKLRANGGQGNHEGCPYQRAPGFLNIQGRTEAEGALALNYMPYDDDHLPSTSALTSSLMTMSTGHGRSLPSSGPLAVASMPTLLPTRGVLEGVVEVVDGGRWRRRCPPTGRGSP